MGERVSGPVPRRALSINAPAQPGATPAQVPPRPTFLFTSNARVRVAHQLRPYSVCGARSPMRRPYPLAGLAAALLTAGVAAWRAAPGRAEPDKPVARPATRAARNTLPLARAVLFNTGVGYLQR